MTTNKLSEKAMLCAVHISLWYGQTTDEAVSAKVAQDAGTHRDAGNYRKRLLPRICPEHDAIREAARDIRRLHWRYSMPWAEDAVRVLPAAVFWEFTDDLRAKKEQFNEAVDNFVAALPDIKQLAKAELRGLYDETSYPTDMRGRFAIRQQFMPLPDSGDFRVDLGEGKADAIREQIEHDVRAQLADSTHELYERLFAGVKRAAERLSDPEAKFKDSLILNLRDLCSLLPKLNVVGDPELNAAIKAVDADLARQVPDVLREPGAAREQAAAKARKIEKRMSALMGGAK